MCESLAANIPSTVDAALLKLDANSRDMDNDLSIGPFGVLRFDPKPTRPSSSAGSSLPAAETQEELLAPYAVPVTPPVPETPTGSIPPAAGDFLQWGDLFDWGADHTLQGISLSQLGDGLTSSHGWDWRIWDPIISAYLPPLGDLVTAPSTSSEWAQNSLLTGQVDLVADGPLLLKHFDAQVIHQMSSLPLNEKSPWRIINLPAAIVTLSQLTLLATEKINHANLSNLYALLAIASYHLSLHCPAAWELVRPEGHWATVNRHTYATAKRHLEVSLEKETQGSKKAKYKEQLMALQAVLAISVSVNTETYGNRELIQRT